MEVITNPSLTHLLNCAAECRRHLRVLCPYVKLNAVEMLLERLHPQVTMQLITRTRIADFYQRASDIAALRAVLTRGASSVRCHPHVHAKVYLMDDQFALVTSANLTLRGLVSNYEYGVMLSEREAVQQVRVDFANLWNDRTLTHQVGSGTLDHIQAVLDGLPPLPDRPVREMALAGQSAVAEDDGGVLRGANESVSKVLNNWQKLIFDILGRIPNEVVSLEQLQVYEPDMRTAYPRARTPMATARRVLQELRDLGLIEFTDNQGTYRKLWS